MDDTLKGSFGGDRWPRPQLFAHEFVVWLGILLLICGVCVWPHLQKSNSSSAVLLLKKPHEDQPLSSGLSCWRLDLNSATHAELECLPGIGPRRAAAILVERKIRGEFRDIWDLCEISGLTRGRVQRLEPLIVVKKIAPSKLLQKTNPPNH
jgi:hypothetical protein